MKKILVFLLFSFASHAQLSPQSKASLVTIAPGKDLYSVFGHSSIWIQDPINGIDRVYSYGTFDFSTEYFYWKFLKGTLPYTISFNAMSDIVYYYGQIEHRTVTTQQLRLNPQEINQLFNSLETNLLPENKEYRYKFFDDNCATRIRDQIEAVSGSSYQWKNYKQLEGKSYRQWMNDYLEANSWAAIGMNLALGTPADKVANVSQSCYLPDNFKIASTFAASGGIPFVNKTFDLYTSPVGDESQLNVFGPFTFLLILSILTLFVSLKRKTYVFDCILFSVYGVLGLFLLFLATATDHGVMSYNPALLILFPLQFPLVFWFAKNPKWRNYNIIMALLAVIGFIWCLTESWTLIFPLLPILIRSLFLGFKKV